MEIQGESLTLRLPTASTAGVVVFDENDQPIDCFGRSRALFGNVFDFAGDLDGDGFEDLIVTHADTDADAFVFYNDGLGQFGDGAAEAPRGAHIIFDEPDLPKSVSQDLEIQTMTAGMMSEPLLNNLEMSISS